MDPICHTLVGGVMARAGLDRWTSRAVITLVIAANLPDVDVLAAFLGRNLELRRGITHGVPALILWPLVLAGLVWLWDRWRPGRDGPVSFRGLVGIAAIGVWSHPFLDYLNNYGMRWLMPFRDQWFYGDSLFIVDPWLYLLLGGGWYLASRSRRRGEIDPARPARIGVALASAYLGLMIGGTQIGRRAAAQSLGVVADARLMVTAVPISPFSRELILDDGDRYRRGVVRLGRSVEIESAILKGERFAEVTRAAGRTREGRAFLGWSRFPVVRPAGPGHYRIFDLRYSRGRRDWASYEVVIAPAIGGR